ncbi:MAG: hypothetical protein IH868_02535, partial [Chloroflexi bacterium]|nr:hypothetical protein [Chloroflexota bacterium]
MPRRPNSGKPPDEPEDQGGDDSGKERENGSDFSDRVKGLVAGQFLSFWRDEALPEIVGKINDAAAKLDTKFTEAAVERDRKFTEKLAEIRGELDNRYQQTPTAEAVARRSLELIREESAKSESQEVDGVRARMEQVQAEEPAPPVDPQQ